MYSRLPRRYANVRRRINCCGIATSPAAVTISLRRHHREAVHLGAATPSTVTIDIGRCQREVSRSTASASIATSDTRHRGRATKPGTPTGQLTIAWSLRRGSSLTRETPPPPPPCPPGIDEVRKPPVWRSTIVDEPRLPSIHHLLLLVVPFPLSSMDLKPKPKYCTK